MATVWKKLKNTFPELHDEDEDCAMKQVEEQYINRHYRLYCLHRDKKPRPTHVLPEDWAWLIKHKRSNQNIANRAKQEMGSKVETKSIAQIAHELGNKETGQWPTAMQVWKATYQKADGTWSISNGEEIQENISSAPVPLVEHLALVLGRKANHSRGVGLRAINGVAEERLRLLAQIEAAEKRAAAAQEHADAAEQRAVAMEDHVQ
ncbi:hypothetical protein E2562_028326, partial [Oryza meyeriana var. granulata]